MARIVSESIRRFCTGQHESEAEVSALRKTLQVTNAHLTVEGTRDRFEHILITPSPRVDEEKGINGEEGYQFNKAPTCFLLR